MIKCKKKSTVLKKYLSTFLLILLASFFTLGIMLYAFVSNYKTNEKKELLTRNATNIADTISKNGLVNNTSDNSQPKYNLKNESIINDTLKTVSENINSDIIVTDLQGKILLYSNVSNTMNTEGTVAENMINEIKTDQFTGINTVGNIYNYECYTVGTPIVDETNNIAVGAVFASVDAKNMNDFGFEITKLFLIASVFALALAFFVIWYLTLKMVKPIHLMTNAANAFGKGDFSQRVEVKTNDELSDLADSFNEMAASLEASEKVRKNFIANVSHELKTPMTSISGFVEGILDGTIEKDKQNHYLEIVLNEVKRLSRLVKSMLNLSKIDDKDIVLHKSSFEILSLTLNILDLFEEKIRDKNVQIQGLEDCTGTFIYADYDLIYQVIYNLLENATKFVNQDGYIKISISNQNNNLVFSIANSGEGISQDEISLIFDRFYKTDKSRSKDKTGIGLGLYIVKKILQLHDGNIKAESIEGKECKFTFLIPLKNKKSS